MKNHLEKEIHENTFKSFEKSIWVQIRFSSGINLAAIVWQYGGQHEWKNHCMKWWWIKASTTFS